MTVRRRSITFLLVALAACLAVIGSPPAALAAAPGNLDVTVENKLGTSWSYDQAPVEIGSWVGTLPASFPSNGSASFSAAPSPEALFAGTAIYMLDKAGPITMAAIHVTAVGEVRAVRCVALEGSEMPDCTYRQEGGGFVVGLYEPLSAPGPEADLSFQSAPAASSLLGSGLPVGLEATKPGHATVSLQGGGRVAAQSRLDTVLPAFPHRVKLKLRPWSRDALRRGALGPLTLRVHLVDSTGHQRTYRRAVHVGRR